MNGRFHLSLCVSDLEATRLFYGGVLECPMGKIHAGAIEFSFYGHQLTCHLDPEHVRPAEADTLDGNHFGAIIDEDEFHGVAARLKAAGARFIVPPQVQRAGTPDERWKLVVADPSGNAIELKCYADDARIFDGD
jgi:extradiol dioxygenase family protein